MSNNEICDKVTGGRKQTVSCEQHLSITNAKEQKTYFDAKRDTKSGTAGLHDFCIAGAEGLSYGNRSPGNQGIIKTDAINDPRQGELNFNEHLPPGYPADPKAPTFFYPFSRRN